MKLAILSILHAFVSEEKGLISFHLAKLGIHDIEVAVPVNQHIAGQQVPRLVCAVGEMPFAYCSAMRFSASRLLTWLSPSRSSASYSWQRLRNSLATARIRLSSESCALSLPCGTD